MAVKQPLARGDAGGGGPGWSVELGENTGDVALDRSGGDEKLLADFLIGSAAAEKPQNINFARGQSPFINDGRHTRGAWSDGAKTSSITFSVVSAAPLAPYAPSPHPQAPRGHPPVAHDRRSR